MNRREFLWGSGGGLGGIALAALLGCGVAGAADGLALPDPIGDDPGTWGEGERRAAGVVALPTTPAEQERALDDTARVTDALGAPLRGAFRAVRRADAAWAAERETEDVLAAWRWKY